MPIPITEITTHVADAKARLPGWLREASNYEAFIGILAQPFQTIESLLIELLNEHSIGTAVGIQLDVIGLILDLDRTDAGEDDEAYRNRLYGKAASLAQSGEPETLITAWKLIWNATKVYLTEYPPATAELVAEGTDPGDADQDEAAKAAMDKVYAGGIGQILIVGDDPLMLWGDSADTDANGDLPESTRGFGDSGDAAPLGVWSKIGTDFGVASMTTPSIAMLNGTDIAYIDNGNDDLRVYRLDRATLIWSLVPSELNIPGLSIPTVTALDETDIALFDGGGETLQAYRWSGSSWSTLGNPFTVTGAGVSYMATLTPTRIVLASVGLNTLQFYDFDGSDWSPVGNSLNPGNIAGPGIVGMTSTTFAFIDHFLNLLEMYSFDGTNIIKLGNSLAVAASTPFIARLDDLEIVYLDSFNDKLRMYRFTTPDWVQVGSDFAVSGVTGLFGLTALNSIDVVLAHDQDDEIQLFRSTTDGDLDPGEGGGNLARLLE